MKGRTSLAPQALGTLAATLAMIALSSCGGSGSSSSTTTPLVTPGQRPASKVDAVAYVSGTPIPKVSYRHWLDVEQAMGGSENASHRALGFLITSSWVLGEATARHLTVSEAEVDKHLRQLEHRSFSKPGALNAFLGKSRQTTEDLRARVRLELLQQRIVGQVTAGKSSSTSKATLTSFQKRFQARWKSLTSCLPAYVMEDCRQYKGPREAALTSTGSSTGGTSASGAAKANTAGEVYSPPGGFSVSSTAFVRNGPLPREYTCDGRGVSPPLEWQNVPKHAAELVLFAIDDSDATRRGGIRWIVGGIDPSSHGVAAGQVPRGGIVGTNTAGRAGYSAVCPAHGHTDTIEFVVYALRRRIALSPGFQPSTAEREYGPTKDLLGQAAVNYAVYARR